MTDWDDLDRYLERRINMLRLFKYAVAALGGVGLIVLIKVLFF